MRYFIDITNKRFGKLVAISICGKDKKGSNIWLCQCDCGNLTKVSLGNLKSGSTISCKCEAKRLAAERNKLLFTKPDKQCSVDGCESIIGRKGANGMCGKHYMRVKRYGDANYITPEEVRIKNNRLAQPNLGKVQRQTYKKLYGKHEHRVIAEKLFGPIPPGHHVHHKDGNRHNNSPENLEILSAADHAREHHTKKKI
jgi:hypothetical protein